MQMQFNVNTKMQKGYVSKQNYNTFKIRMNEKYFVTLENSPEKKNMVN